MKGRHVADEWDSRCLYWPHREQARSHRGAVVYVYSKDSQKQLWERACSR
ncbi:hypothetical protein GKKCFE_02390 [Pseudomonas sp. E141]|nr:hypothetical protein SAMN05216504_5548 [Pseudomonas sp. A214]